MNRFLIWKNNQIVDVPNVLSREEAKGCYCVDTAYARAPEYVKSGARYGIILGSNEWEGRWLSEFPDEFRLALLLLGIP